MAAEERAADRPRHYWPSFLRGGNRAEIFARLSEGDPLRLQERTARRLRERWLLIDPDRAHARAVALCADGAAVEDAPRDLESWAVSKVDLAMDQILLSDLEEEHNQDPVSEEAQAFPMLTHSLLIAPERVRPVTIAFNGLESASRRAFFELMIDGREVIEVIEGGPWDADQLHDHITLCLGTLGYPVPPRKSSLNARYPKKGKES